MGEISALSVSVAAALPSNDEGRLYPPRPLLAASLAVFREGRVLLASRAVAPYAGCFSLPGGLVEPGETLAEAAVRETREEVGVDARVVAFNRHVEVIERDAAGEVRSHYVIASFVGEWIAGEGRAGPEAGAVLWAERGDLTSLETTEQLGPLLDAIWPMDWS